MHPYSAFHIHNDALGHQAGIEQLPEPEPAEGEVLIRIHYSSVNYKDALAAQTHGWILVQL